MRFPFRLVGHDELDDFVEQPGFPGSPVAEQDYMHTGLRANAAVVRRPGELGLLVSIRYRDPKNPFVPDPPLLHYYYQTASGAEAHQASRELRLVLDEVYDHFEDDIREYFHI